MLSSDDTSEATVPAMVTIPDGQESVPFTITAVDDSELDGTQTVTITASADGFDQGNDSVDVVDDDVPAVDYVTIDDGDAGYTTSEPLHQSARAGFGGDVEAAGPRRTRTASWAFTGLADGTYSVQSTWTSGSDRSTVAPYRFVDVNSAVLGSAFVDQTANPDGGVDNEFTEGGRPFQVIGTVTVTGGTLTVELSSNTGDRKSVIADAVRIAPEPDTVNDPPSVQLQNTVTTISEAADTSGQIKVADVVVVDDTLGTNQLALEGDDAGLFELVDNELFLRAGTTLDAALNPTLDVTVTVDDTEVGETPDGTAPLSIIVEGVLDESYITIDDGDAGFATTAGTIATPSAFGGDVVAAGTRRPRTSTWTFNDLTPGDFEVSTTWLRGSDRATNATYNVYDGDPNNGGTLIGMFTVDQQNDPNGSSPEDGGRLFETLGTVSSDTSTVVVELSSAGADGAVIADCPPHSTRGRATAADRPPRFSVRGRGLAGEPVLGEPKEA